MMCQVEHLHSLARRSLATRQIITGEYHPDDLPGGIWHHGATLDVCWFVWWHVKLLTCMQ